MYYMRMQLIFSITINNCATLFLANNIFKILYCMLIFFYYDRELNKKVLFRYLLKGIYRQKSLPIFFFKYCLHKFKSKSLIRKFKSYNLQFCNLIKIIY